LDGSAAFGGIKFFVLSPSEGKDLSREKQSPKKNSQGGGDNKLSSKEKEQGERRRLGFK